MYDGMLDETMQVYLTDDMKGRTRSCWPSTCF